jgi:hypothetical protein
MFNTDPTKTSKLRRLRDLEEMDMLGEMTRSDGGRPSTTVPTAAAGAGNFVEGATAAAPGTATQRTGDAEPDPSNSSKKGAAAAPSGTPAAAASGASNDNAQPQQSLKATTKRNEISEVEARYKQISGVGPKPAPPNGTVDDHHSSQQSTTSSSSDQQRQQLVVPPSLFGSQGFATRFIAMQERLETEYVHQLRRSAMVSGPERQEPPWQISTDERPQAGNNNSGVSLMTVAESPVAALWCGEGSTVSVTRCAGPRSFMSRTDWEVGDEDPLG